MKKIYLAGVALLGTLLFNAPTNAFASENVSEENANVLDDEARVEQIASGIQYYDGEGNPIYPYSFEELKEIVKGTYNPDEEAVASKVSTFATAASKVTYNSGATNFRRYIMAGGGLYGKAFKNPTYVSIEPKGTAKKMSMTMYLDKDGALGKSVGSVTLPGGWQGETPVSWQHLTRGKKYHSEIANESTADMIYLKNIAVEYEK